MKTSLFKVLIKSNLNNKMKKLVKNRKKKNKLENES